MMATFSWWKTIRDDVELAWLSAMETASEPHRGRQRMGVEALDYLFGTGHAGRDTSHQPRVVLLDINLPKINGLRSCNGCGRTLPPDYCR